MVKSIEVRVYLPSGVIFRRESVKEYQLGVARRFLSYTTLDGKEWTILVGANWTIEVEEEK